MASPTRPVFPLANSNPLSSSILARYQNERGEGRERDGGRESGWEGEREEEKYS